MTVKYMIVRISTSTSRVPDAAPEVKLTKQVTKISKVHSRTRIRSTV